MSEFTKKVAERIKREGIEPEPGWKFTAKRTFLWIGVVLTGGIAALSLSMTVLSILSIDRSPFTLPPEKIFSFAFFRSLPFFWIGLLVAFSSLAMIEFRNTRHGYRHRIVAVAVISGIAIMFSASLLSAWGADERAERMMNRRFPHYAKMMEMRNSFWSRPEAGFLSGTIDGITRESISITDDDGTIWIVTVKDDTKIRPSVRIEKESAVKILGKKRDGHVFEAEEIRPWKNPMESSDPMRGYGPYGPTPPGNPRVR